MLQPFGRKAGSRVSLHFPKRKTGSMPILKFLEGETREKGQLVLAFELDVLQGTLVGWVQILDSSVVS